MAFPDKTPLTATFATEFIATGTEDTTSADFAGPKIENRYCLLELPKDQLEALESGGSFYFQEHSSGNSDNVALVTHKSTFGLEFLENSNTSYVGLTALSDPLAAPSEGTVERKDDACCDAGAVSAVAGEGGGEASGEACETPAVPPSSGTCTIFAQTRGHLILKPLTVDSQRVRDLLANHPLGVDAGTHGGDSVPTPSPPPTTAMLQYKVAASAPELQTVLADGPYVEHEGAWRWIPVVLEREIIDVAVSIVVMKGWDKASVDGKKLLREVQAHFGESREATVPSLAVLRKALRSVEAVVAPPEGDDAVVTEATGSATKKHVLSLDADKIRYFQAMQILRDPPGQVRERFQLPPPEPRAKRVRLGGAGGGIGAARDPLQMEEFGEAFRQLSGDETSAEELENLLGDRIYIDEIEGTIQPLDVTSLPQEPRERLKRLFELKSHWRPERLTALIAPCLGGQKPDAWIMKYTRAVHIELEKGKEVRMLIKKFAGLN